MWRATVLVVFCILLSLSTAKAAINVCTVIEDAATGKLARREGDCDRSVTPASTFKIAISMMGYDSGFLRDEHTPALPFHEGYADWNPTWRQTTDPTAWIANSVFWYSQQITASLGEDRFKRYTVAFHYGNANVSGDAGMHNGLNRAWVSSSLKISPLEQVAFLRNLVERRLPVNSKAFEMTSHVTSIGFSPNGWTLHGKTGTGAPKRSDGSRDWVHAYGWFVGWATKANRTVVFARLIQDNSKQTINAGLRARDALLRELPTTLNALESSN